MKKQLLCGALLTLLVLPTTGFAEGASSGSNAYVGIEKYTGEGEKPVNPTDPDETVKPGPDTDGQNPHPPSTKGPLSVNYISNLQFGSQAANGNDAIYEVQPDRVINSQEAEIEVPNYVQVTDHRGTNSGWTLLVKQDGAFKNGDHSLTGTELVFNSPVLSSKSGKDSATPRASTFTLTADGEPSIVMVAAADQGMGTWIDRFGEDVEAAKTGIQLKIPGDSKKVAGFYQTSLTWTLSDTPVTE